MTRNNLGRQFAFFHVSPKSNRQGIESKGLLPNNRHEGVQDVPAGVYLSLGKPGTDYGDDVYQIHPHEGFDPIPDPMDSYPAHYAPNAIAPNNISRVGHIAPNGRLHWHKEEDCSNG
jgi:hypothetical protein